MNIYTYALASINSSWKKVYFFNDSPVMGTVALQFWAAPQGLMPLTHSRVNPEHINQGVHSPDK